MRNNNSNYNNGSNRSNGGKNSHQDDRDKYVNHSGAKKVSWMKKDESGKKTIPQEGITAWNYSKGAGMVSVFIYPYEKSDTLHECPTKPGTQYVSMMCRVFWKNSGVTKRFPVLVNVQTDRVVLDPLGWVVNPNVRKKNGAMGYCGTFKSK